MPIYYHVTILETTCVILKIYLNLNVVWKIKRNLCRAAYAICCVLAEDSKACFQLDGIPAFGVLTNMGENAKKQH